MEKQVCNQRAKMYPIVSVLMTSYNREKFIAEAIESVLHSSLTDFELIIVDDASRDRTVEIARRYQARDPRIRLYVNERNLGDYANRNRAASYARGKYLKYLDSDDVIYEFGLAYCVEKMEQSPEAAMASYVPFDLDGDDSQCWPSSRIIHEHFFSHHCFLFGPSGAIFRRDKFFELGGYDTRFNVISDTFFNVRMASEYPMVLLRNEFFLYRTHEGQEKNNRRGYLKFGYLYFKELMEHVSLPLARQKIEFLKRKLQKRHAINLTKFLAETLDWKGLRQIMVETHFTFTDMLVGYFQ